MKGLFHRLALLALGGFASLALISCGGSSSSSEGADPAAQRSGTVGILLTDMPADPALFASINASIESIVLLGSDDNGKVTVYSGPTKTFDLLRLRNEAIPFSFKDDVPAGRYCKIRLILSDLELVLADDTPHDPDDNPTFHPHLPGNGKLDLVVQGCFEVVGGQVLTIQIDIDAGNSIHIVGNNNGFNFRPVILAEVLRKDFDAKLVRLEGKIAKVDPLEGTLLLCGAIPTHHMYSEGCVDIHLGDDSAFFDNRDYSGAPRSLDELLADDKVGQKVTVIGWPRHWVRPYFDIDDPDEHEEYGYRPLMVVDGLVVELGDFLTVEGKVATDADDTGFDMKVSRGGPVITNDTLGVMLQPGWPGVNGTRIVSKHGALLTAFDIVAPLPVQVDGVLELIANSDPLLKAALVVLDTGVTGKEQVTGKVLSVGADTLWLDPDADTVCGIVTDQLMVGLAADLKILTVTITDDGSHIEPGGTIAPGQDVGMNGTCKPGGYETDNLVIVEDLRI